MTHVVYGSDTCEVCGHPADPHVMLSMSPMLGGIGRCPVEDCDCHFTWSPNGVPVPSQEVQDELAAAWELDREAMI